MEKGNEITLDWLKRAVDGKASDVFVGAGRRVTFKKNGVLVPQGGGPLSLQGAEEIITGLYGLAGRPMSQFMETGDDDFPATVPGLARFRVNAYRQRSSMAAVVRVVMFEIPDYRELRIPEEVMRAANEQSGLVLVTGPAGSGKSTTLACIVDAMNKRRNSHIITMEDPIEFLHRDDASLISQREVSTDTKSYMDALRASLRQAPDVILLGEMRDHETTKTAITAAETGHLVISTLHTVGAANTIDRMIDIFPPSGQQQVRVQLSISLRMAVSQRLMVGVSGQAVPAFEIMRVNNAISNIIREGKTHQIDSVIQQSSSEGMICMDAYIMNLLRNGEISEETALRNASNAEWMKRHMP